MPTQDELPATEVFAIIEEPTAQMSPIRTLLFQVMAVIGVSTVPGGTHPVVVHKATGKKMRAAALTVIGDQMQADIGTMSAGEFRRRYLDL